MSATGRSDVRRTNDVYITPDWCVKRLLEKYRPDVVSTIMDPCAARGELLSVAKRYYPDANLYAIELRTECLLDLMKVSRASMTGNFLELAKDIEDKSIDLIITNPPFVLAMEFIKESIRIAKKVAMLLRLNFVRGENRDEFMRETKPSILALADRPSFTGRGTDATEYGWFVWDEELVGRFEMLKPTGVKERSSWNVKARALHPIEKESV